MVNILTSRKAEEQTLFSMMTVVLVLGVVLFSFLAYINQATSSTYYQKNFLATDLALLLDTIQLLDGNLELIYAPISTKNKFLYEFQNSQVKVSDSKLDVKKGNGYFLMNKNIKLKNTAFESENNKIIVGKEGNVIFVNENRAVNLNTLECPKEKVPFVKSLTVKGGELASTVNKIAASDFEEGNDLVLNVEVKDRQKNYLKIFYPKNRERIACEIANRISEVEPFDGVSIIPSNIEKFEKVSENSQTSHKSALNVEVKNEYSKPSELTLEFSKNYDIKTQTAIASAIIEGVKNAEK